VKRREVIFSPEAENDLAAIFEWIAARAGTDIALGYIERIEVFCRDLDLASERGALRNDIRPGLRVLGFERRLTIAIAVSEERVTVLRLFYGGQDWAKKL
jgi:toxin ParE1/3/4